MSTKVTIQRPPFPFLLLLTLLPLLPALVAPLHSEKWGREQEQEQEQEKGEVPAFKQITKSRHQSACPDQVSGPRGVLLT